MKKRVLALLLCVAMMVGFLPSLAMTAFSAEETILINGFYFPDENFRSYVTDELLASVLHEDRLLGKYAYKSDVEAIEEINVAGKSISKLAGIEYFTGLKDLYCENNDLTELDVSENTALTTLVCDNNQLTKLDVSKNTLLVELSCSGNQLAELNVFNNTALTILDCSNNCLAALDLSNNDAITSAKYSGQKISAKCDFIMGQYMLDLGALVGTQNLSNVVIDVSGYDATTGVATFTSLPETVSYNYIIYRRITRMDVTVTITGANPTGGLQDTVLINSDNFPDENFRSYLTETLLASVLQENSLIGTYVNKSDLEAITEINVCDMSISDLTGIEYFTGLTSLDCSGNQLTALDLSSNTKLTYLSCEWNQLTALSVTKNTALEELYCNANQLITLDVRKNTALKKLYCQENKLPALDVTNNIALVELSCWNNELTALDVSNNLALKILDCGDNQLTELNLLKNTALEELCCNSNKLTELNLFNNRSLTVLACQDNCLATLELSRTEEPSFSLPLLNTITCSGQKISAECSVIKNKYVLDMKSIVGSDNLSRVTFDESINYSTETGSVTFIALPDTVTYDYSIGHYLYRMDVTINLSASTGEEPGDGTGDTPTEDEKIYINEENFPDANFRSYLTGTLLKDVLKIDKAGVYVYKSEAEAIEKIEVYNKSISDLRGIEYFVGLMSLDCSGNQLFTLELSSNKALGSLNCSGNQLDTLDVSRNTALVELFCSENDLYELYVGQNTALKQLRCQTNQLSELDLSKCTALFALTCDSNQLEALDLSNCANLDSLSCVSNFLTELDLSKNTKLTYLSVEDNMLTELNLSGNPDLQYLNCMTNELTKLDLSNKAALETVNCGSNALEELNVSGCTNLYDLDCNNNQLTALDVSSNTALGRLICYCNNLTALDMSACTDLYELDCSVNKLATLNLIACKALTDLTCDGQNISAECGFIDGVYTLNMNLIVGSANLSGVNFDESVICDDHGIVTFADLPESVIYNYTVFYGANKSGLPLSKQMDVTVSLSAAGSDTIPVDTDDDQIADTNVEAEPGDGLTYVDADGNIYIPIDSDSDGETDFYVEVTENEDGDYPYTDNFGNDYIPVDVDGDGTPDVFVSVAGDQDNDGNPEDENGNEYEGVDTDNDGTSDYWKPIEEETGYTAGLDVPTEKYSVVADYFAAAGITVTGLAEGEQYATGDVFYVSCENACVVAISFDGVETYTELVATQAEGENTYSFTLPELTGDFVIGIVLKGDADGDGKVTSMDALRIQRYATNDPDEPYESNYELDSLTLLAADANGDGKVNSTDALRVQRYATNDPDEPHAEGSYELLWNVIAQ